MNYFHLEAKVISRGSGRSAVAASAYASCSEMYNDYDGVTHDYRKKTGLVYSEVILPAMAPAAPHPSRSVTFLYVRPAFLPMFEPIAAPV